MTPYKVLGIDYSVTCPACCVIADGQIPVWWVNYKLHGKPFKDLPRVTWTPSTTEGDMPRFAELAEWVRKILQQEQPDLVVLEDYAFAASGRITQLAENGGILKYMLYEFTPDVILQVVAPTTMKKFATGKGTATKDIIWTAFLHREPYAASWQKVCHPKALGIGSPMADIADSYFLAHYGRHHFGPKLS
jgi:hypothetical protein